MSERASEPEREREIKRERKIKRKRQWCNRTHENTLYMTSIISCNLTVISSSVDPPPSS